MAHSPILKYTLRFATVVSRLLLVVGFLFSGFVKVSDPAGMAQKLAPYAEVVHLSWGADSVWLQMAAVGIGTVEFVLGMQLLLGISRKTTTRCILLLTTFFTALTLWLLLTDAVPDCGCFSEAITLTHAQTFAKNIVLLIASVIVCLRAETLRKLASRRNAWIVSVYTFVFSVALSLYTLHYLPVIDYAPYKVGSNLRNALSGKDDSPDALKMLSLYIYDSRTEEDYVPRLVADTSYSFLLTVPDITTADDGTSDRINDLYDFCADKGYAFYMVTASDSVAQMRWIDETGASYPLLEADPLQLRALVRSNPGLIMLHDGKITGKWGKNDMPLADRPLETAAAWEQGTGFSAGLRLLLWFLIPCGLVLVADTLWIGKRYYSYRKKKKRIYTLFHQNTTSIKRETMRKKIVAGNWKMNKNLQEGIELAKELQAELSADKPSCGVIICTPYIHLASVAPLLDSSLIGLGAENCADKEKGAYTGEVSAEMVKSTGAQYVILGHSERRAYYHETPEILREKVHLALAHGLDVIFCIGEVLEEREQGKQNEVVKAQLEGSLFNLTEEEFAHVILAYEPVWAIGTGKTATAEQAEEMHAFIRQTVADKFGGEAAENVTILYGGSCKPSNAKELFAKPDVDGGLIGGAALKAGDFKGIIDAWKK